MSRRMGWAAVVIAFVVAGVGGYELLRSSAHRGHEMTITGKK